MSDEELAAIKARVEAATPGPWSSYVGEISAGVSDPFRWLSSYDPGSEGYDRRKQRERDGAFIAHAREDIPALLAENAALRAGLADVLDTYPYELVSGTEPPSHDKARALLAGE